MAEAGRPTELTDEVLALIKAGILEGRTLKEIANINDLSEHTLYHWHSDNYAKLYDKVEGWKRDRKLNLANRNIEAILQLDVNDKDFVKTVSDMSKFVAETLDKKNYSKRNELTGADGKDIVVNVVNYGDNTTNQLHTEGLPDTSDTSS